MTTVTNVILFGESGSGKSSIVNMLSGGEVAAVSNGVEGCTLENVRYKVDVLGREVALWDTSGLDDGEAGRVPNPKASVNLYNLLRTVRGGISLLVFVTRPRIKGSAPKHWKLFHKIICREEVPIVILVTGLEEEQDMRIWWRDNQAKLHNYGMYPDGHACITASRGKKVDGGHVYDKEFEESKARVQNLLMRKCRESPEWISNAEWFKTAYETTYEARFFGVCRPKEVETRKVVEGYALRMLIKDCGVSKEEAWALARKMDDTHPSSFGALLGSVALTNTDTDTDTKIM